MPALFFLFICSALAAIAVGSLWPSQWAVFAVLKPLTTLLIIAHAARRGTPGDARRRAVLVGLCFSTVGDVALLWPQQGFLPGLVSFLLAHLAYLAGFSRGVRWMVRPQAVLGYGVLAGSLLTVLWPGVPPALRAPVLLYVLALSAMAAQTASWAAVMRPAAPALAACAALGGLLFVASDATLAFNRFHSPVPASSLWILASYWAAQWLIASSLPPRQGWKA